VAHSSPALNNGVANSSTVTRLSGPGFRRKRHVITGLPRAIANHAINSIHFRGGNLFIAQGGNTGAGAPNESSGSLNEFGRRPEQPLSAALLVAPVRKRGFDGSCAVPPGSYAIPCDVRPWATGLRNIYDFVFHSNGFVYGADNGASVTPTFPPKPTPPCEGSADPRPWNQGGDNPGEQTDTFFRLVRGGYHGHPNPYRRECVFEDGHYQRTSALRNFVAPIHDLGRKKSYNGIIEYRSTAFGGALRGDLLTTSFAQGQHILRIELSKNGWDVVRTSELVGNLADPLPLAQGPDGTIYVGEFGAGRVTVLRPAT
jgi:glucose/arabinose dehydrogenase